MSLLPLIKLNHFLRVNGQLFVGIDHDAEEAGVGLWEGEGQDWSRGKRRDRGRRLT